MRGVLLARGLAVAEAPRVGRSAGACRRGGGRLEESRRSGGDRRGSARRAGEGASSHGARANDRVSVRAHAGVLDAEARMVIARRGVGERCRRRRRRGFRGVAEGPFIARRRGCSRDEGREIDGQRDRSARRRRADGRGEETGSGISDRQVVDTRAEARLVRGVGPELNDEPGAGARGHIAHAVPLLQIEDEVEPSGPASRKAVAPSLPRRVGVVEAEGVDVRLAGETDPDVEPGLRGTGDPFAAAVNHRRGHIRPVGVGA